MTSRRSGERGGHARLDRQWVGPLSGGAWPAPRAQIGYLPETALVGFDFACHCLAVEGHDPLVDVASGRLVLAGEVVRAEPEGYAPWRSARRDAAP